MRRCQVATYVAAKLGRAEGDVYAMVYVNDSPVMGPAPYVVLRVVEERPMQQTLVRVDAIKMAQGIAKGGHVALYGIYFDTDKADVKPESKDTLDEMAKLLRSTLGSRCSWSGIPTTRGPPSTTSTFRSAGRGPWSPSSARSTAWRRAA